LKADYFITAIDTLQIRYYKSDEETLQLIGLLRSSILEIVNINKIGDGPGDIQELVE
jgi:hypothetical protein